MANIGLSEVDFDLFCRSLARLIKKYYEDPENLKKYEAWKAEQEAKAACE